MAAAKSVAITDNNSPNSKALGYNVDGGGCTNMGNYLCNSAHVGDTFVAEAAVFYHRELWSLS